MLSKWNKISVQRIGEYLLVAMVTEMSLYS